MIKKADSMHGIRNNRILLFFDYQRRCRGIVNTPMENESSE